MFEHVAQLVVKWDGDGQCALVVGATFPDELRRVRKIVGEMKAHLKDRGFTDYSFATVASFAGDHSWDGKNIAEITKLRGAQSTLDNQVETIFNIMTRGGAQMVYHSICAPPRVMMLKIVST